MCLLTCVPTYFQFSLSARRVTVDSRHIVIRDWGKKEHYSGGRNVAAADIRSLRGSHGWDVTLQGLHRATLTYLLRAVYADCMQSVHPAVRAAVHWAEQKLSIFLQHLIPVQSAE